MRILFLKKGKWWIAFAALFITTQLAAQNNIKGKVTDKNGTPLIGASITIKNTTKATLTDSTGNYSIEAQPTETLVISSVGYTSQEIAVASGQTKDVQLAASAAHTPVGSAEQSQSETKPGLLKISKNNKI